MWCQEKGIERQYTNVATENAIVERAHRSLMEMVPAMLKGAGMEKEFWVEAVRTATFIKNRTYHVGLFVSIKSCLDTWIEDLNWIIRFRHTTQGPSIHSVRK